MEKEIQSSSVQLVEDLSSDMNKVMSENVQTDSPFMALFW